MLKIFVLILSFLILQTNQCVHNVFSCCQIIYGVCFCNIHILQSINMHTVQAINSCSRWPVVSQCLIVKNTWIICQKMIKTHQWPTELATQRYFHCEVIHAWKSGVRSCIMPEMLTHLVQKLNVGTAPYIVQTSNSCTSRLDVSQCLVVQTRGYHVKEISQAHQWPT